MEKGETSLQAALRELEVRWILFQDVQANNPAQEEAGITAPLEHAGSLLFLAEGADFAFHIDIYRADEYSGTISEYMFMQSSKSEQPF